MTVSGTNFVALAKDYGIFAAMVCFFVWWSYVRESALNARIDRNDEFIRSTLVTTLDNNTKAIEGFRLMLGRRDHEQPN